MLKAYSYIRFSSAPQVNGGSLERQKGKRDAWLATHPSITLDVDLYLHDLGISAFDKSNVTRGALGGFLKAIQDGRVAPGSYLLVESLDRLSRAQVLDALSQFIDIINAGVIIETLIDGQSYSKESVAGNPMQLMMSILIMSRAHDESATKSDRIRSAWDKKRANIANSILTRRCPQWMKPKPDGTGFELIAERAEIVKRIFKMASDGKGSLRITQELNADGRMPFGSSKLWAHSSIEKILHSPAAFGAFQPQLQRDGEIKLAGDLILNYYPAVITREEFERINVVRKNRRVGGGHHKGQAVSNLFSGYVTCGYCDGPMQMGGYVGERKDAKAARKSKYLSCGNARKKKEACHSIQWNYKEIERWIFKFLREVDLDELLNPAASRQAHVDDAYGRLLVFEAEQREVAEKIDRLLATIEDEKTADHTAKKIVNDRIAKLGQKQLELEAQLNDARAQYDKVKMQVDDADNQKRTIIELLDALETLEGDELYNLRVKLSDRLYRVFEKVVLYPGGDCMTKAELAEYQAVMEEYESMELTAAEEKKFRKLLAKKFPNQNVPNKAERRIYMKLRSGVHRVLSDFDAIEMPTPEADKAEQLEKLLKVIQPIA